jgi:C4-dicarboxylate-specific signal transduction histidine kinase
LATSIESGTSDNKVCGYGQGLEEAAHADRVATLGYLAAGLSHELAQPLLAAHNFSTVALSLCEKSPAKDDALTQAVTDVHNQIERATQIVKRIQNFIAWRKPACKPFDLNSAVKEVAALLSHESLERKVHLKLNLQFALPSVYADNVLVQQVIVNLLRNAMDAVADLNMEARNIDIETSFDPPDQVRLTVTDQGPGIGTDDLDSIFAPFHSTKSSGLGLGLWLSRTIIEANGGHLWAEKRPSGGAKFSFTLPVTDGATKWK